MFSSLNVNMTNKITSHIGFSENKYKLNSLSYRITCAAFLIPSVLGKVCKYHATADAIKDAVERQFFYLAL